jgi:Chromo (CHRromatin Organisation MOdifier) domain
MDDVLLRALPDGEDPPAVQELLDATERARTVARESIEQMNARMAEHVNAHRRDVQFQIWNPVLLSTQNLRLPVGTTHAEKFASRWIGPFAEADRISDGRAYRLDLPSHMHLHPTLHVSLLKPYFNDTQPSRSRPAPMPDLFADGHEEWEVSPIVSHRWRTSHLQYLVPWVGFAEHENSWVSESDFANSPNLVTEYWAFQGGSRPENPSPRQHRRSARGSASSIKGRSCYGARAMNIIGCAGPPTPSKIRMYHTLVAAPAFLAISSYPYNRP